MQVRKDLNISLGDMSINIQAKWLGMFLSHA